MRTLFLTRTPWLRRLFTSGAAALSLLALDHTAAWSQDIAASPPEFVVASPESAELPIAPDDLPYHQPPATDLEARVQALEQVIRSQAARQRELEEQLSLQTSANLDANLQPARSGAGGTAASGPKPYTVGSDVKMSASWRNGLEIQSANKDFRIHVGGRTQFDTVFLNDSPAFTGAGGVGDADSMNFRRARLRIDGTLWDVHEFASEWDFVNSVHDNIGLQPPSQYVGNLGNPNVINVPAPTDLWWDVKELPFVGHWRFGNMKEPLGLEHQTSSRFLDFMERSFNQDAFTGPFNNGFTPGMMIWNVAESRRATYQLGVFKNTTNVFAYGVGDGEYAADGRLTWLPYFDEDSNGRGLFHLGISGSLRDPDEGVVRYRSRGSLRNGPGAFNPVFADTGTFFADQQQQIGAEAALVWNSWHLQAEYFGSNNTNARPLVGPGAFGDVYVDGYYVQALYFLTGEHRAYDHERGAFGRVVPLENWFAVRTDDGICSGWGAWQVGARYSRLDLNNSGINGGIIQDVTLGLNWFWNPNMKWQFNYVVMDRQAPATVGVAGNGTVQGVGVRFAHDF
jgi:phosphate-selective porin OprO/OprP